MAAKQLSTSRMAKFVATAIATLSLGTAAFGATSTYVQTNGNTRSWNGGTNWASGDLSTPPTSGSGPVPSAAGDVAILQQSISTAGSGNPTISLNQTNETVGILTVRDTTNLYTTVIGTATTGTPGVLIFDNGASPAQLNESGGTDDGTNTSRLRVTAGVQLNSDLIINQSHLPSKNTGTEFAGPLSGGANVTITKTGVAGFQMGYVTGQTGTFFGAVDVQQGLLRIINPNTQSTLNNFMLAQSSGVYVHDGAQLQLGNTLTSWGLGANANNPDGKAVLTLEGIGNTSNTAASLPEGALRFDQANASPLSCDVTSPIMLATTSRIYVASSNVTGVLTQEVRGTGTAGLNKGGSGLTKIDNYLGKRQHLRRCHECEQGRTRSEQHGGDCFRRRQW